MNKEELVTAVCNRMDVTKTQAICAVNAVFDAVQDALISHDSVSVPGFGKFSAKFCEATTRRNPNTGKTIDVPQHFVVRFSPAKALKDAVR